jgi:hypothetical protein
MMGLLPFPYVVVRYDIDNARLPAVVLFYAVSMEQASYVFQALISVGQVFDPTAHYAIRYTDQLYPSLYGCACRMCPAVPD